MISILTARDSVQRARAIMSSMLAGLYMQRWTVLVWNVMADMKVDHPSRGYVYVGCRCKAVDNNKLASNRSGTYDDPPLVHRGYKVNYINKRCIQNQSFQFFSQDWEINSGFTGGWEFVTEKSCWFCFRWDSVSGVWETHGIRYFWSKKSTVVLSTIRMLNNGFSWC